MQHNAVNERISLTYQDHQKNEVELPFRVLILSDLTGDERADVLADQEPQVIEGDISEILAAQNISLKLKVTNYLWPERSEEFVLEYNLISMDDFDPENIIRGIPELRQALRLHTMLSDEKVKAKEIEPLLETFGFTASHKTMDSADRRIMQADLEQRLNDQLDTIVQHKRFRALEASWRSLNFLQGHVPAKENIQLVLLNTTRDAVAEDFEDSPDITQSTLFQLAYSAEFGQFGGRPYGMIIGDFEITPNAQDMALLRNLASVAAMSHCPFIGAAHATFFGIDDYTELSRIRDVDAHFGQPQYAKWNSFRETDDARYVTLTLPRFLLRPSHDVTGAGFTYTESRKGSKGGLWGNAAYALATRFVRSFAQFRWYINVSGEEYGIIHDLEVRAGTGAMRSQIPTEVMVSDRSETELVKNGFTPLTIHKASRKAGFFAVPSCKAPSTFADTPEGRQDELNQRLEIQLPFMLISCRFSQYLKVIQRENIGSWTTRSQLDQSLNQWIKQYVSDMDNPAASVRAKRPLRNARIAVRDVEGKSGWYLVKMSLTPHFKYMGQSFTLTERGKLDKA